MCLKYFAVENARLKLCLSCKRFGKGKARKQQNRATEEIREINGQKVKVILVNDVRQLDHLNQHPSPWKSKDPLSEPLNIVQSVNSVKTKNLKQKRRQNSPSKVSKKKAREEALAAERPDQAESPVLSDPEERTKVKFQCVYCSASFIFPNLLETHSSTIHGKFYYCHFCFIMFAGRDQLAIHQMECLRVKIDPKVRDLLIFSFDIDKCTCNKCELTLDNHKQLLIHAKSYHGHEFLTDTDWLLESSYSCCGLTFPTRVELVQHKKSTHGALDELTEVMEIPCPTDSAQMECLATALMNLKMISYKCPLCPIVNYSIVADNMHQRIDHGAASAAK